MTDNPGPDDIPHDIGSVLRITQLAERIGTLDQRETAHHEDHTTKLSSLFKLFHGQRNAINEQRQMLAALDGTAEQVKELAAKVAGLGAASDPDEDEEDPSWYPQPTFPWWEKFDHPDIDAAKRDQLLAARKDRLQEIIEWVTRIFRPGYGHIAEALPPCWPEHQLLVHVVDTLCEMWTYLYLNPKRGWGTLREQAELQTRYLPAWAKQMELEGAGCRKAGKHVTTGQAAEGRNAPA